MNPRPYHDKDFHKAVLWSAHLGPLDGKRGETHEVSIQLDRHARIEVFYAFAARNFVPCSSGAQLLSLSIDGVVRATFNTGVNSRVDVQLAIPEGSTLTAKVRFNKRCTWVGEIFGKALPPQTLEDVIREEVRKQALAAGLLRRHLTQDEIAQLAEYVKYIKYP